MEMPTAEVIDVDSHFWEPFNWLAETDPELQAQLDDSLPPASFAEVVFGEVIAELPERQQAEFMDLFAAFGERAGSRRSSPEEMQRRVDDSPLAAIFNQPGARDADERLAWCDGRGIDRQIISPTTALGLLQRVRRARPDLLARFCRAYNDWSTDLVAGHTDRLIPTALVDFAQPSDAVAELTRVRGRGSRAFLVPMYPVAGRSLAHVDHEQIWSAAVDLGMVPVMHVATGSVTFDTAWCTTGRDDEAKTAFLLASSLNAQIAQIPLANLVLNGVFDRHPDLRMLCSEFGLSWVPGWLDKLGVQSRDGTPNIGMLLGWTLPKTAVDYVRDHVVFSPLKHQRVDELIDELGPQSVAFATDYPHPEGSADALAEFRAQLDGLDALDAAAFYGGTAHRLLGA